MNEHSLPLYLLLAAVGYLIYKVHRLERLLGDRQRRRPRPLSGDPKLIPILKDDIPPGPFKTGNRQEQQAPPPPAEPEE